MMKLRYIMLLIGIKNEKINLRMYCLQKKGESGKLYRI
jgi:hypothetical protein